MRGDCLAHLRICQRSILLVDFAHSVKHRQATVNIATAESRVTCCSGSQMMTSLVVTDVEATSAAAAAAAAASWQIFCRSSVIVDG